MSSQPDLKGAVCPTCHRPLEYADRIVLLHYSNHVLIDDVKVTFTPKQMDIFKAILKDYPDVAAFDNIYDRVYPLLETWNPPEPQIISQQICKMRKRIEHTNLRILSEQTRGFRFVFVTPEPGKQEKKTWQQRLKNRIF